MWWVVVTNQFCHYPLQSVWVYWTANIRTSSAQGRGCSCARTRVCDPCFIITVSCPLIITSTIFIITTVLKFHLLSFSCSFYCSLTALSILLYLFYCTGPHFLFLLVIITAIVIIVSLQTFSSPYLHHDHINIITNLPD